MSESSVARNWQTGATPGKHDEEHKHRWRFLRERSVKTDKGYVLMDWFHCVECVSYRLVDQDAELTRLGFSPPDRRARNVKGLL